jgi:hypothetical protein
MQSISISVIFLNMHGMMQSISISVIFLNMHVVQIYIGLFKYAGWSHFGPLYLLYITRSGTGSEP